MRNLFFALLLLVSPLQVRADVMDDHIELWNTIKKVGIEVDMNNVMCENKIFDGLYFAQKKRLIICQDDVDMGGYSPWSANDYDTLRHEAHHIVQDCSVGGLGSGYSGTIIGINDFERFVDKSDISDKKVHEIITTYTLLEASPEEILMEIEAYIVAMTVNPSKIDLKIQEVCIDK